MLRMRSCWTRLQLNFGVRRGTQSEVSQPMTDDGLDEHEAAFRQLMEDVKREGARVLVDWAAAGERILDKMRQTARIEPCATASEIQIGLDATLLIRVLQSLPSGAGTDAFVAAFTETLGQIDSPPA